MSKQDPKTPEDLMRLFDDLQDMALRQGPKTERRVLPQQHWEEIQKHPTAMRIVNTPRWHPKRLWWKLQGTLDEMRSARAERAMERRRRKSYR